MARTKKARRVNKALAGAILSAAAVCGARSAAAQTAVLDLPTPGFAPPPSSGSIEASDHREFWRAGRRRWFLAASADLGAIYGRSTVAVGFGRPHWLWGGLEASSAVAPGGGTLYGGVRYTSPRIDVRTGVRYLFAVSQHFLLPRETYTRDQTEERLSEKQRYMTIENEIAGTIPVPRANIYGIAGVYWVPDTPRITAGGPQLNFFDQNLQVVASPGIIWRGRLGFLTGVDKWDTLRLGAAIEAIGNPPRDLFVLRTGPSVAVLITHHLEAFGTALLVVYSKDKLGLAGGQTGELGFRYRWATGDRWPELP